MSATIASTSVPSFASSLHFLPYLLRFVKSRAGFFAARIKRMTGPGLVIKYSRLLPGGLPVR